MDSVDKVQLHEGEKSKVTEAKVELGLVPVKADKAGRHSGQEDQPPKGRGNGDGGNALSPSAF